jgi:hypothetical protein
MTENKHKPWNISSVVPLMNQYRSLPPKSWRTGPINQAIKRKPKQTERTTSAPFSCQNIRRAPILNDGFQHFVNSRAALQPQARSPEASRFRPPQQALQHTRGNHMHQTNLWENLNGNTSNKKPAALMWKIQNLGEIHETKLIKSSYIICVCDSQNALYIVLEVLIT